MLQIFLVSSVLLVFSESRSYDCMNVYMIYTHLQRADPYIDGSKPLFTLMERVKLLFDYEQINILFIQTQNPSVFYLLAATSEMNLRVVCVRY